MYWNDLDGGDIRRANLDGTGQTILVTVAALSGTMHVLEKRSSKGGGGSRNDSRE
jgi:hypothetical protein